MQESGGGLWFLIICLVILDNIAMPKVNKSICIGTTIAVLVLLFTYALRSSKASDTSRLPDSEAKCRELFPSRLNTSTRALFSNKT